MANTIHYSFLSEYADQTVTKSVTLKENYLFNFVILSLLDVTWTCPHGTNFNVSTSCVWRSNPWVPSKLQRC